MDRFRRTAKDLDGYSKSLVLSITVCSVYGKSLLFQMGCERSVNHS